MSGSFNAISLYDKNINSAELVVRKFIIIDAYGFLFRAYYVMPNLKTSTGIPIGGVYGFINMLLKYITNTDYLVVVFDSGDKNFRHNLYPAYKANRPGPPEDLVPQFSLLRDAVKAFNLVYEEVSGFEADDVIATLSQQYGKNEDIEVVVVSADKDLLQLLLNGSKIYDPIKNKYILAEDVLNKFGVTVDKLLDLLALTGDASDNIPGVPGIGVKTAAKLLNEFDSLNFLLQNAAQIKQAKCRKSLIKYSEQALLSRELISLRSDVKITFDIEKYKVCQPNKDELQEFLGNYEFKTLFPRIDKLFHFSRSTTITTAQEFSEPALVQFLANIYYEGSIAVMQCQNDISLARINGNTLLIPAKHLDNALQLLNSVLLDCSIRKIFYDFKEISKILGVTVSAIEDVKCMSYCIDSTKHNHSLNEIVAHNLPETSESSAYVLILLFEKLKNRIIEDKLASIYYRLDLPLAPVLRAMEDVGVLVEIETFQRLSVEFAAQIQKLEHKIYDLAGEEFNIASPKQLSYILFEKMQLTQTTKLKSGNVSTNAGVLEELSLHNVEIADMVLSWRHFYKLKTTYTDSLIKQVNPQTGRIHTTYSATSTSTGRLSSSNPNLQNIPIRSNEGTLIRQAFIAKPGHVIISADYSQIELRLIAHIGKVQAFKAAFINGEDIHAITAKQIFGSAEKQYRYKAKAINFGIIYGISAFGLAKQLGIDRTESAAYIADYFKRYPEIKIYMEEMKTYAKMHGYVKNLFGRRCFITDINNSKTRGFAERLAINAPLQGTASDIIKLAMVHLSHILSADAKIILQIHDELLIEVPENLIDQVAQTTKKVMESVCKLSIPMEVDINIGKSWGDMSSYNIKY